MHYWAYYFNLHYGAYALNSPSVDCSTGDIGANRISFGYRFYSQWSKCGHEN